jgi:hypothetical protein
MPKPEQVSPAYMGWTLFKLIGVGNHMRLNPAIFIEKHLEIRRRTGYSVSQFNQFLIVRLVDVVIANVHNNGGTFGLGFLARP